MIFPNLFIVDDHGGAEASSWIDASASDRNCSEMNHENSEPNGEWSQHRNVGISGVAFGISGGEDGVEKDEGADDLDGETGAFAVAVDELVGGTAIVVVAISL